MNILNDLAKKYGTDKSVGDHHYTIVYHGLFNDKRNEIKKVLEIGIANGDSLRMWRDYFPSAQIYGIDNDKNTLIEEERIKSFLANQEDEGQMLEVMKEIGPDIDLIVDDGGHEREAQIISAKTLLPFLKKGGLYIVEDLDKDNDADSIIKQIGDNYKSLKIDACVGTGSLLLVLTNLIENVVENLI
jgi:hypothetical protein